MAIRYDTLLPDVLSMVPACPEVTAERAIRSAVIDICEKTDVYQEQLDPITAVKGIFEYDLEPPTGTVVHRIVWVTYDGKPLEPVSTGLLEQRKENWRNSSGTPEYFVKQNLTQFYLVPIPAETLSQGVQIRVALKPTHTSTACNDTVMTDYRDTIINGALFRLTRMPAQDFTDFNAAGVYNTLYNEGLVYAERRSRQADNPVFAKVRYGGLERGRRTRKYSSKRTFL